MPFIFFNLGETENGKTTQNNVQRKDSTSLGVQHPNGE
jgi:hypothetical protein